MTELRHDDIRWRVSNTWDKGSTKMGMLVGYIDARTAMDALDAMDPKWSAIHGDPIIVGGGLAGVPCALTVNGITRSDVGMPSSQEPIKGAYSDALKRAAVHHGIGRELYELPKIAVECEVGANGKVKGPKALPEYRNGRWTIDHKYGWVRYEREPDEREPVRPPAEPTLREQISLAMHERNLGVDTVERYADAEGVPKGTHATDDQLRAILARIQQPVQDQEAGGATPATPEPVSQPVARAGDGPEPEESAVSLDSVDVPPAPATSPPAVPGDTEPPRPGTDAYRALPSGKHRAAARAYWDDKDNEPEQVSLAEALGAPEPAS